MKASHDYTTAPKSACDIGDPDSKGKERHEETIDKI